MDSFVANKPECYVITCSHPSHLLRLGEKQGLPTRLIGIFGNGSKKSPNELNGSCTLESDDPDSFAADCSQLAKKFSFKIFGGCCGNAVVTCSIKVQRH